ncbi:hypothetical protein [uncultured Clostridium sp.]|uniref:hypothetical protein n=1 Tax=uncultured Clostridium sp. TaxID=59620 RepID=UPI0025F7AFAE|nr:hypothetical protein [uncultured Clostridium sp.]
MCLLKLVHIGNHNSLCKTDVMLLQSLFSAGIYMWQLQWPVEQRHYDGCGLLQPVQDGTAVITASPSPRPNPSARSGVIFISVLWQLNACYME